MPSSYKKTVSIVLAVFLFVVVIITPFTVFGGMKAYADECVSEAKEPLKGSVNEIPHASIEEVKSVYASLPDYKSVRVSNPVSNGVVSSNFNTVDSAHSEPHNGTDFASTGDAYAVTDGVVVANTFNSARGFLIAVAFKGLFGQNYTYLYQHLSEQSPVSVGTKVVSGQRLGTIGNTGLSSGVHLHAEVEFADMTALYPRWKGTYPTNTKVMFDFLTFFNLGRTFNGQPGAESESQPSSKKCASSGVVTNLEGNTNAEKIWNALIKEGFSKEATAGIIGNLMQESQCDPKARQSPGPGRGIMQWTENERWASMIMWAKNQDPWTLETQISWMLKELKDYGVYNQIKPMTNIRSAVELFEIKMEAAGIPRIEARYKYAIDAYAKFNK